MSRQRLASLAFVVLAIVLGTLLMESVVGVLARGQAEGLLSLPDTLQNFVTVFLGIFIEAVPFLLLGTVASGLIAVYVTPEMIARTIPRNPIFGTLAGVLMGMVFPVCECGVVPVVRRLYRKGLPTSVGIAFLLGAPVLNPIVIASTYAAFGLGPIFWGRIVVTFVISFVVGLVFAAEPNTIRILRPRSLAPVMGGTDRVVATPAAQPAAGRVQTAFAIAADDFFDMVRYLVVGALISAALQSFVPQQALVGIGGGAVSSVIALQLLAFVLSVCSTVDAFLALSFVNTFTIGALIAFLVFGPMVDIKSVIMYLSVFRARVVFYIVALVFLMSLAIGVFVNLNVAW